MQTNNPYKLELVGAYHTDYVEETESFLHKTFKHKLVRGEWFSLDGNDLIFLKKFLSNNGTDSKHS